MKTALQLLNMALEYICIADDAMQEKKYIVAYDIAKRARETLDTLHCEGHLEYYHGNHGKAIAQRCTAIRNAVKKIGNEDWTIGSQLD